MIKRTFDVLLASTALLCLWPLFVMVAIFIKSDSDGPVFFTQERIGKGFRPFWIYKFRTMFVETSLKGRPITCRDDPRVTRIGRFLRRAKIDELPQLINVLKGEMSIVGPRPELRRFVEAFREDYVEILMVRPGITDPASLKFRDEASLLGAEENPEEVYLRYILPEKLRLGKQYVRRPSMVVDLRLIIMTLAALPRVKAR